ncbi:hypothetical protein GCM10010452_26570 [Crossiella cryophila]
MALPPVAAAPELTSRKSTRPGDTPNLGGVTDTGTRADERRWHAPILPVRRTEEL